MPNPPNDEDPDRTRLASDDVATGPESRGLGALDDDLVLRGCLRANHRGEECPMLGQIAILSRIGKGGMGFVYRGVHVGLDREVAVKVIPPTVVELMPQLGDRFRREARLAAQVESPHIVRVFDVAEDSHSRCLYIVMELVRGFAADEWARRYRDEQNEPVRELDVLDICIATTRGLAAAHLAGIVHRDVKPSNILVPGEEPVTADTAGARLADLGLAYQQAASDGLTMQGQAMGTPGFMAPEQVLDAGLVGPSADVFSMGATLYALLAGVAPFASSAGSDWRAETLALSYAPLASLRTDVSEDTAALVDRCLQREPSERHGTAAALLRAIEDARTSLAETAQPGDELGRFRITEILRHGGFSIRYRAEERETGQLVDLRVPRERFATDPVAVRRMDREARALARINHPGVARLIGLEHCSESKQMLLVTEPMPANTLVDLPWDDDEGVRIEDTLEILRQFAAALHAMHESGVIHGCVAGRKLQIDQSALAERRAGAVVVHGLEFCIIEGEPPITNTIIGIPYFMAREQFDPAAAPGGIDARVDVYALGVIAYMLVAGKRPYSGNTPREVLDQVMAHAPEPFEPDSGPRDALWPLVNRMLSPDREDRPATMTAVLEALPKH